MDWKRFEEGYDVDTYVNGLRNYRSFVRSLMKEAEASGDHVSKVKKAAAEHTSPLFATMMTEDWCGDSACNLPVLSSLFEKADVPFRVFRGSEQPDLEKKYQDDGSDHIPVVSVWDGAGNELVRWVEAPAEMSRRKDEWKSEHPEFMELYRKKDEDKSAAKEFASLYRTFIETMAAWYKEGVWEETTGEVVHKLDGRG